MARGAVQAPFDFFLGDSSNWKTPAKSFLTASLGETVSSRGVDYRAQEDARQLSWRGNGRALASVQTQRQVDFTPLGTAANLNMTVTYRLDKKPDAPVLWTMGCGDNCNGKLDITNALTDGGVGSMARIVCAAALFCRCRPQ